MPKTLISPWQKSSRHSTVPASRRTALRLGHILPVCSLIAPCPAGAGTVSVLARLSPRTVIATLVILTVASTLVLGALPKSGDRAPELAVEKLLNGPADNDLSWAALKGKATVIEFWATWCGPCVGAIPHLNELADELSGRPIRFLSVTDEDEETIGPFLKAQPISGWVGLDLDRSVFQEYGVLGIPVSVLVDRQGIVQAVTAPRHVTKTALLDLIAGRRPDVPSRHGDSKDMFAIGKDGPEPVYQVLVRPTSITYGSSMSRSANEIKLVAFRPENMVQAAFEAPEGRLLVETELPDQKYDVVVNTGNRPDLLKSTMRRAVSAVLGVEAVWEERLVDAYVLRKSGEPKLKPLPNTMPGHYSQASKGSLETTSVETLANMVAAMLGRPVLDETGLGGPYRIKLKFDPDDHTSVARAIESTLGLEMVPAKREVRMLIVRKKRISETK